METKGSNEAMRNWRIWLFHPLPSASDPKHAVRGWIAIAYCGDIKRRRTTGWMPSYRLLQTNEKGTSTTEFNGWMYCTVPIRWCQTITYRYPPGRAFSMVCTQHRIGICTHPSPSAARFNSPASSSSAHTYSYLDGGGAPLYERTNYTGQRPGQCADSNSVC